MEYIVLQVELVGPRKSTELERAINLQASKGYRLHTMSTFESSSSSIRPRAGKCIKAILVFEKI